jgi:hypothetical protein
MTQNEFRIGNYVTDSKTGKSVTVDGIQFTGRIVTHDESYDDWKRGIEPVGIPLTPEILEKAGFVGDDSRNDFYKDDFRVAFHIHDGVIEWRNERLHEGLIPLHQLQNLYFALTGEELPIEL